MLKVLVSPGTCLHHVGASCAMHAVDSAVCRLQTHPSPAEALKGFTAALCMHVLQCLAFLSLLISSGMGQDQECPSSAMDEVSRKTFLLFGDSLTQRSFDEGGWGGRLASAYQRKVSVGYCTVLSSPCRGT